MYFMPGRRDLQKEEEDWLAAPMMTSLFRMSRH